MRKLKLQVQISVDGFVGGPDGEMDWMTWNWDDALKQYANDLHAPVDTILLGRKMTDGFVSHWAAVAINPEDPTHEFGKKMIDTPKVVFTKTLKESVWPNTTLATGDITEEVNKLKSEPGGDIIVYGGAGFVSSLIKARLIDELHLFVNPCAIGRGMTIFAGLEDKQRLTLAHAKQFECGIVVQCYKQQD
jgi:dihydrofolate reductase